MRFKFQVTNVKCPIIALQDLLEAGFVPKLGVYASTLESPSGRHILLAAYGCIWYLQVKRVVPADERRIGLPFSADRPSLVCSTRVRLCPPATSVPAFSLHQLPGLHV